MAIPGELIPMMAIGVGAIAVVGRVIIQPVVSAVLKLAEQRRVEPRDSLAVEQRLNALDERFSRLERSLDRLLEDRDFFLQLQAGKPRDEPPQPR